jgi:hypothetical protein
MNENNKPSVKSSIHLTTREMATGFAASFFVLFLQHGAALYHITCTRWWERWHLANIFLWEKLGRKNSFLYPAACASSESFFYIFKLALIKFVYRKIFHLFCLFQQSWHTNNKKKKKRPNNDEQFLVFLCLVKSLGCWLETVDAYGIRRRGPGDDVQRILMRATWALFSLPSRHSSAR